MENQIKFHDFIIDSKDIEPLIDEKWGLWTAFYEKYLEKIDNDRLLDFYELAEDSKRAKELIVSWYLLNK